MHDDIKKHLDSPKFLEQLYRSDPQEFKKAFDEVYPEIEHHITAQIWNERLSVAKEEITWGSNEELWIIISASVFACLMILLPKFTSLKADFFYPRNTAFVIFPILIYYYSWKRKVILRKNLVISIILLGALLFINLLPQDQTSSTFVLSCIHLPLFLWALLGYTYLGGIRLDTRGRLDYLKFNGDLIVMTSIIILAGILMCGLSFALFTVMGYHRIVMYAEYVALMGLAAAPIFGAYLVQTNPHIVNKISPVIARLFTPLVLLILVFYLIAILALKVDPYKNREFLLIFNLLLICVMALVFFSVVEISERTTNKLSMGLLLTLSVFTVIINGIALSAILFRISEWGFTPNRVAVLGGNVLILTHLVIVTYQLSIATDNLAEIEKVKISIGRFLPVYTHSCPK